MAGFQQAPFSEPPAPAYALPEPAFLYTDPSQVGPWAGGMWPCTQAMWAGLGWFGAESRTHQPLLPGLLGFRSGVGGTG